MELVEFGDGRLQGKLATGHLQALRQVGGAGEQHPVAILDERQADGGCQMTFAGAGRPMTIRLAPSSSQRSPALSAITCALETIGHSGELEGLQRLAARQMRFAQTPLEAPAGPVGDLVLGQDSQQPGGWPALAVGLLGEPWPQRFDARQTQLAEHEVECGGVDGSAGYRNATQGRRLRVPALAARTAAGSDIQHSARSRNHLA